MAGSELIPFGAGIAADVLSTFQLPGGSTFVNLANAHVAKKRKEAADILTEEIASGFHGDIKFEEHDVDPLIETILRFSKAVAEGAAHENLRLLAQVIVGLKKNKALSGDKFRRWCGILEHLTRDELLVIGKGYSIKKKISEAGSDAVNDFWQQLGTALQKAGYTKEETVALAASVSRTGLLVPVSAWNTMVYMPTPWLEELGGLADLENLTKRGC